MIYTICASLILPTIGFVMYRKSQKCKKVLKLSYVLSKAIIKFQYLKMVQYINGSVKQIGKNTYEVNYIINNNLYKMIVMPTRGPCPVLQVINDRDEDVTDEIMCYLGPNYNFHGKKFSVDFFGCETLTFEFGDGTTKTYTLDNHLHSQ
jgi:hypothetical protein